MCESQPLHVPQSERHLKPFMHFPLSCSSDATGSFFFGCSIQPEYHSLTITPSTRVASPLSHLTCWFKKAWFFVDSRHFFGFQVCCGLPHPFQDVNNQTIFHRRCFVHLPDPIDAIACPFHQGGIPHDASCVKSPLVAPFLGIHFIFSHTPGMTVPPLRRRSPTRATLKVRNREVSPVRDPQCRGRDLLRHPLCRRTHPSGRPFPESYPRFFWSHLGSEQHPHNLRFPPFDFLDPFLTP